MNHLSVSGYLGADSRLTKTSSGDEFLRFNVAAHLSPGKGADVVDPVWFAVTVFGRNADNLSRRLLKGTKVAVSGSLSVERYKDKTGAERNSFKLKAQSVDLLFSEAIERSSGGGASGEAPVSVSSEGYPF